MGYDHAQDSRSTLIVSKPTTDMTSSELHNPHDRFFKEVWSRKAIGQDFLQHYLPSEIVALLDLDSLELTKESFVDKRLRQHYSDLLYTIKFRDGTPGFVYILLEHKRTPERLTALQVLRYLVQIWEKALAQGLGKDGLPPILPVVLYQGDSPWPYGDTLQQIVRLPAQAASYVPDFHYVLCDLTGFTDAEIRGAVLLRVSLLVMKHIGDERLAERLPGILRLLGELREKHTALEYLETLLRYLATAAEDLSEQAVGEALNEVLPVLEEQFVATLAQKWLEQGRAEGEAKGLLAGERRVLLRQVELRFGPLPDDYQARIAAADSDTLLIWSQRVLSAQRLEEVSIP